MYYLYHIPGKKIGVTRNLNRRVTGQQGYSPDEYEVLDRSEDIDYISDREIELQKSYGYRVDMKKYKELKFNKMNINPTEQTSTFPCPVNKLKGRLMDNLGLKWSTPQGYKFSITEENIPWIMNNVRESMYDSKRSYIYNKPFYEAFFNPTHTPDAEKCVTNELPCERFDLIRDWAATRGIYDEGNTFVQYVKLQEEAGELAKALLKRDKDEIKDAIGDMVVVLTNLAHLENFTIEQCIDAAYTEISTRKGKMINGTFVKDE
jgi:NTP pyrophosphatase (non-canonical NTP hydrolase)